jgi:hypothetical protein
MTLPATVEHQLSSRVQKRNAKIIWYPQRDTDKDSCLQGCYAISAGKKLPTFQRSVLPSFPG